MVTLDEPTRRFLAAREASGAPRLFEMTPQQAREFEASFRDAYGPGPEVHQAVDHDLAVGRDTIRVRVLTPTPTPAGVIVYYHGGGWVIGDIDDYDTLGRILSVRTGCTVVLANYRLAPEHPYPAAVEDAWTALLWADEHVRANSDRPLVVAGDSAGGCLAAVVARRATRRGGPALALQVLVYPVTDCDFDTESYRDGANQLLLTREAMEWFWDHYAPDLNSRLQADASPARADDLAGLPPAVVITAEHDVLRDDGEGYAKSLRAAGVPVELRRFEGQMHGFFSMINLLPASDEALRYVAEMICRSAR